MLKSRLTRLLFISATKVLGDDVANPQNLGVKPIERDIAAITNQFKEFSYNNTIVLSPFSNAIEEAVG